MITGFITCFYYQMYIEQQLNELTKSIVNLEVQISKFNSRVKCMEEKVSVPTLSNIENLVDADMLYTVAEVSKILKTNTGYVYSLIKAGLIPALKLGSLKIRRQALLDFLQRYEGKDLSDPDDVKALNFSTGLRGED